MTPETIADNVKRLRSLPDNVCAIDKDDALKIIKALVELVGEMREEIKYIKKLLPDHALITFPNFNIDIEGACYRALTKSAPIAALKEKA